MKIERGMQKIFLLRTKKPVIFLDSTTIAFFHNSQPCFMYLEVNRSEILFQDIENRSWDYQVSSTYSCYSRIW